MCLDCESDAELSSCPFDAEEYHPSQWPDDATRADIPDDAPEPSGWDAAKHKPLDSNGRPYNPYEGSRTPTEGRCNASLTAWNDRYGELRYCQAMPESTFIDDGSEFCRVHKSHDALMERAADAFTHGIYSKTISHVFEKLDSWQQLTVLAFYDSYIQESVYDFAPKLEDHTIDFSDYDGPLPIEIVAQLDEEERLDVGVPIPTEREVRGFALYRAAVMDMKAGLADRALLDDSDGTVMERETTVTVTDDGREVTDMEEHHLNLPLSRLDGDRKELLAFGGVDRETDSDVTVDVDTPESLIVDLDESENEREPSPSNPVESAIDDIDEVDDA